MAERAARRRRVAWDVPIVWLIGFGAFAIVLAFTGWFIAFDTLAPVERAEESFYRALSVNTLSESYARPIGGADGIDNTFAEFLLLTARWIGAGVFFATLLKVVIGFFLQGLLTWWCKTTWRDHVVIVGSDVFAREAAEAAAARGLRVVHFHPGGRETTRNGVLTLPSDVPFETLLENGAAHRARSLIFATEDPAIGVDLARTVFEDRTFEARARRQSQVRMPGEAARRGPHIFVHVEDGWFEHREELDFSFHKRPAGQAGAEDGALDSVVELISESRCAARAVLAAHPLFTLKEGEIQHVLILGFGSMGEALLTEICETQRVDPDNRQKITILDPDPMNWERFTRRCPEWAEVFDGVFLPCEVDDLGDHEVAFLERADSFPPTAAYVATGAETDPALAAARLKQSLVFQAEAGRLDEDDIGFPIFTCVRGVTPSRQNRLAPAEDGTALSRMPIVAFGAWDDVIVASHVLEAEPDRAAFAVHATHNELYSDTPPTNWSDVAEVNRYSSRSAAAFVPALIHAAGFDLKPWLAAAAPSPPEINDLPSLPTGRSLAEDESELVYLARLEHIRWCAERRLRGFRHADQKSVPRKRHPDLVSFGQLPEGSQIYNVRYIRQLSDTLDARRSTVTAPPRENARRVIVRPSDYALLEKAGLVAPREMGLHRETANVGG